MDEQANPITEEVVANVSRLVGLNLSAERIAELLPHVQLFFGLFSALDQLDLDEVEPTTVFSAEWR